MFKLLIYNALLIVLPFFFFSCSKEESAITDNEVEENEMIINDDAFYVAPNGNDENPGTYDQPWATWGKAFTSTSVNAGDVVYFRGGIYKITVTDGRGYNVTRTGTSANWILYSNYPGEVPVLDCSNADPGSWNHNMGVTASTYSGANYIIFKGLTIRNVHQLHNDHEIAATGFTCENGNFRFENCTAYNIDGHGFDSFFYKGYPDVDGNHNFINCDAYNCSNPYAVSPAMPGNAGVGFNSQNWYGTEGHAYVKYCRAWKCGDQGFSWNGEHYCEVDGCWSFYNGLLQGDGFGFKLGWHDRVYGGVNVVVKNSVAAFNRAGGMTTNDSQGVASGMNIYNNTIYYNGYKGGSYSYIYGTYIYNTPDTYEKELGRIFRNNLFYGNEGGSIYLQNGAGYTHSNNSWDASVKITREDFQSIDSTGITGPRQPNGSLPDLNFLKLAKESDLINAGTDTGQPFLGKAPDLGAFERE